MPPLPKTTLCAAFCAVMAPVMNAQHTIPIKVEFNYDRTAPVAATYNKAKRIARRACKANTQILSVKNKLERSCVTPLLEGFVLKTEDAALIAHFERKTGKMLQVEHFAAN